MCGIYGYVSKKPKDPKEVVDGLKLLEYRGYDSWGVATKEDKQFVVEKHVGKIGVGKLSPKIADVRSTIAIGHTRWATHGGVTIENAHPHLDCTKQIAVVHNGIIENFEELRDELKKKGHKFVSETDTEVFPHLVEEYLKNEGFASSVRDAFNRLSGLNALVVAYAKSSEIIAVKSGSPLCIGKKLGEFYVSSDATGIIKHTRNILFLEDNQMAILGSDLKLIQLPEGSSIKPKFQNVPWKFEQSEKGKFKHFLLKEIFEQPAVIENIALTSTGEVNQLAELIDEAFGTFMLGCGTASYAALAGTYLFSDVAKKHVNFTIGSEFKYFEDYITNRTLVIPISQSGETIDVVEPVSKAKKKGAKIAAIVNVLGSTLYRQSDFKILLNAGIEKAVIGTKSFIAMYAVLLLTAYSLVKKEQDGVKILLESAKDIERILKDEYHKKIKNLAKKLKNSEHIYILGRGLSYAAALEATLKIKETSYIHAEGFAGGELKHGVISLIDKGTPCIIFASNDDTFNEIISNAQEVKARGGYIIGVGPRNNGVFDVFLQTADIKEATLIPQVVISQLLAYNLALERGVEDPDKPRNLAKSVTVK